MPLFLRFCTFSDALYSVFIYVRFYSPINFGYPFHRVYSKNDGRYRIETRFSTCFLFFENPEFNSEVNLARTNSGRKKNSYLANFVARDSHRISSLLHHVSRNRVFVYQIKKRTRPEKGPFPVYTDKSNLILFVSLPYPDQKSAVVFKFAALTRGFSVFHPHLDRKEID